jgi:hypothetical protein
LDAAFDTRLAMFERPPGVLVDTAQERAAYTALYAMEAAAGFWRDEL